jgi:hypothetical protein
MQNLVERTGLNPARQESATKANHRTGTVTAKRICPPGNDRITEKSMLSTNWAALALALTLPFLHACGNDDANQGHVRIVNATTEYPTLDLYTEDSSGNDNLVVGGTAPGTVSSYTGVDKGSYTFDIKSGSGAGVAATVTGTVGKTDHYTVVTYLTGNALQATYLTDEETNPSSGNAKLRIFNAASTEAGGLDIYLATNACNALAITDTALATNVTTLQTSFSQVTAAAAGTDWHVCVTATGDKSNVLLDIPKLTLTNQEIATLILTRTTGGVLLNASVLDQQGALKAYPNSIARVRVVADAATNGLVSATINGVALSTDAASPSVGDYVTVPAGTVTPVIQIADTAINGVSLSDLTAGSNYTLLVAGTVGAPSVTLIPDDNTPSTSTSLPVKMRVINGLNGAVGAVSVTVDSKLIGSAGFGSASSYTSVASSTGTSTVRVTGTSVQASVVDQTFASGQVYTVFVYGDLASPQIAPSADR